MTPQEQARKDLKEQTYAIWDTISFGDELKEALLKDPTCFALIDYLEIFDPTFDLDHFVEVFRVDSQQERAKRLGREWTSGLGV
jgi:hypothetical protein